MEHHLHTLLTRGGTRELPRRVAYIGGDAVELYTAPNGTPECHVLSKICEMVRESLELPIYSRDVTVLLHHCLYTGDARSWEALAEDTVVGLLCEDVVETYFKERPDDAAMFVSRFQDARSMCQSASILTVFSACLGPLTRSREATMALSNSMQFGKGSAFLVTFADYAKSLPLQTRFMALESLGSSIRHDHVFDSLCKDVMESNVYSEDVLAILVASPCASSRFRAVVTAAMKTTLLSMMMKAPIPRKTVYLNVLACILRVGDDNVEEIVDVVTKYMNSCGNFDTHVFSAAARVIRAIVPADDLRGLLARAVTM